ncbi:MAG TPA: asparagine synthetase B, partial [Thermoanaerobaculia bacterium]
MDGLTHRGPDDRGCLIRGSVGLGVRRLSIIDVEGGRQPMSSEDGSVHLVYNGETYNHVELRRELESLGHRFRTHCDTEVVLVGYRHWGIRALAERLNGIYAFALWDETTRTGHLCRDRMGVKPLY